MWLSIIDYVTIGPFGNHKLSQLPLIVIYWRKYHQNGKCGFHVWQQWKVIVFVENSSHASNRCHGNSENLRTSGHLPYIIHNVNTKYHWPGLHTWTTSNWTRLVDARLIVYSEPSHWLNQCWRIVIWIAGQFVFKPKLCLDNCWYLPDTILEKQIDRNLTKSAGTQCFISS